MMSNKFFIFFIFFASLFAQDLYYYNGGKKIILKSANSFRSMLSNQDPTNVQNFVTQDNINLGVSRDFLAKLAPNVLITDIEQKFNVRFVKIVSGDILMFKATSAQKSLSTANALVEQNLAVFAHPDFIQQVDLR